MPKAKREKKTVSEMRGMLKKFVNKGTMNKADHAKFRRKAGRKTGWKVAEVDAWLAELADTGAVRTPELKSPERRESARKLTTGTEGQKEQERMRQRVTKWVREKTEGKVTAAQLKAMRENLRSGAGTAMAVEATVAAMEREGVLTVEDRVRKNGGGERKEWREESTQWAKEQGWMEPRGMEQTERRKEGKEACAVEIGTGWEGATEGLRKVWDRVATLDKQRQTMKIQPRVQSAPDFQTTFEEAAKQEGGIALWMARGAGMRKGELAAIWASPDCSHWSTGQGFQKHTKDTGTYTEQGTEEQEEAQEKARKGVRAVLDVIKAAREKDPTTQYTVEQPELSEMRREERVVKERGMGMAVPACAYGERQSGKKYRRWMSKEEEEAFVPIQPRGRDSMCEHCKKGKEHPQAAIPKKGSSKERIKLSGHTNAAARNRVPPGLAEAVAKVQRKVWRKLNGKAD